MSNPMKSALLLLAIPSLVLAEPAPVAFDTPAADAILSKLQILPKDHLINTRIADWPVHPASAAIVASVGVSKPLRCNTDMAFIIVPPGQKLIPVTVGEYANESDAGPFPVPEIIPIEGWPAAYKRDEKLQNLSLTEVQRDSMKLGGDRHGSILDPTKLMLYEFYQLRREDDGWHASQASVFDLKSNKTRTPGWTSTDAAGLPLLPFVVRYDELEKGEITHALRVTVRRTRREYVAPATHFASRLTDASLPRMGERFRLRENFDVSGFSPQAQAILKALKTYGMIVADNGIEWAVSITPDLRIPDIHEELRRIRGSDFEVVTAPPFVASGTEAKNGGAVRSNTETP